MKQQEFILDIIVNKLEIENEIQPENENILVKITFDEITLDITSSQINVTEFREGRSIEFKCNIDLLKDKLTNNPLQLSILNTENQNEVIGNVTCEWPFQLLDKLSCKDFSSHAQIVDGRIIKDESEIGAITIAIKLYCKCTEDNQILSDENVPLADNTGRLSVFNEMNNLIDSTDALFVIGESMDKKYTNALNFCADTSCPMTLNTSRYRTVRGTLVKDSAIINPCRSLDCSGNKVESNQTNKICNDIFESLNLNENQPNRKERQPCETIFGTSNSSEDDLQNENECTAEIHSIDCPARKNSNRRGKCTCSVSSNDSSLDSTQAVKPTHKPNAFLRNRNTLFQNNKRSHSEIIHDTEPIQPRCCAMCNADISWLPKYSYCPKCGYKTVPYQRLAQTGYNKKKTADDVLKEWGIGVKELSGPPEMKKPKNRCTCTSEKVCAHCRIKIMCGELLRRSFTSKNSKEFCCRRKSLSSLDTDRPSEICREVLEKSDYVKENSVPHLTRALENLKNSLSKSIFKNQLPNRKPHDLPMKTKSKDDNRRLERQKANTKNKKKTKRELIIYMKKKFGRRYNYSDGKQYPGLVAGHKTCLGASPLVPPNMGWLWNVDIDDSRRGWRPGAVRRPIKAIMTHFLKSYPIDTLPVSSRNSTAGRYLYTRFDEDHIEMMPKQKPTLQVRKARGEYNIIMHPLKDEKSLRESADPYLRTKPIQFKIVKNPVQIQKREIKKFLKKMGYKKCTCKMPIACCYCRSFMEKERMELHVTKICKSLKINNLTEDICFTDTSESESELDIEFTPPAGLVKPSLRRKPNYACKETQYLRKDFRLKRCGQKEIEGKYNTPAEGNKMLNKTFGRRVGTGDGKFNGIGKDGKPLNGAGAGAGGGGAGGGGAGGGDSKNQSKNKTDKLRFGKENDRPGNAGNRSGAGAKNNSNSQNNRLSQSNANGMGGSNQMDKYNGRPSQIAKQQEYAKLCKLKNKPPVRGPPPNLETSCKKCFPCQPCQPCVEYVCHPPVCHPTVCHPPVCRPAVCHPHPVTCYCPLYNPACPENC